MEIDVGSSLTARLQPKALDHYETDWDAGSAATVFFAASAALLTEVNTALLPLYIDPFFIVCTVRLPLESDFSPGIIKLCM